MEDLASPFGNFGRPGFPGVGWIKASELLNASGSDGRLWRHGRGNMQQKDHHRAYTKRQIGPQ
jgi:hypothetical protein